MLVVTGPVKSGDRQLSHGDPIPEALSWSPHVLKTHLDAGWIRDVTEEEAAAYRAAVAAKQAQNDARNHARALAAAELAVSNAEACHSAAVKSVERCAQVLAEAEATLKALGAPKAKADTVKAKEPEPIKEEQGELDGMGIEELRDFATGLGVEFDKRWGADRLRKELNEALAE